MSRDVHSCTHWLRPRNPPPPPSPRIAKPAELSGKVLAAFLEGLPLIGTRIYGDAIGQQNDTGRNYSRELIKI